MAEVKGHPTLELKNDDGDPVLITLCSHCGNMKSILFLTKDRWICFKCKTEGATPPNLYPVS